MPIWHLKNHSAYWIPEQTIQEVIHGTTYIVTGSYEGQRFFTRKLERIMARKLAEDVSNALLRESDDQNGMLQMKEEDFHDNESE